MKRIFSILLSLILLLAFPLSASAAEVEPVVYEFWPMADIALYGSVDFDNPHGSGFSCNYAGFIPDGEYIVELIALDGSVYGTFNINVSLWTDDISGEIYGCYNVFVPFVDSSGSEVFADVTISKSPDDPEIYFFLGSEGLCSELSLIRMTSAADAGGSGSSDDVPVSVLSDLVSADTMVGVFSEILKLLPIALGALIFFIGLRKALAFLSGFLRGS